MNLEELPSVYVNETSQIQNITYSEPKIFNRRSRQKNERKISANHTGWTETPPPDPSNFSLKLTTRGGYSTSNSGADSPYEAPNSDGALRLLLITFTKV